MSIQIRRRFSNLVRDNKLASKITAPLKWADILFFSASRFILGDEQYLKMLYKRALGRPLNLAQPEAFSEKLQWLKLYDKNPLKTKCADKLMVREYVNERIGEKYLIPLIFSTANPAEIPFSRLPDKYIIKTNHGSGTNIIVDGGEMTVKKQKMALDKEYIISQLKRWLRNDFSKIGHEWEYKDIPRRVLVEELLRDESGNKVLNDYKIHCFNGKAQYIQTITDRLTGVKENWYTNNWESVNVYYFSKDKKTIKKPDNLIEILMVAEKLAAGFLYVRVDLYLSRGNLYFGELTFHPAGGFMNFVPNEFDLVLGNLLTLPAN